MDEELLQTLRDEAVAFQDVTDDILKDRPNTNPDFLAVYYRMRKNDDRVLRAAMENKYSASTIAAFDLHFDTVRGKGEAQSEATPSAAPKADKSESGMFGTVASGLVDFAVDVPEAGPAGMASFAKSFTANTLETEIPLTGGVTGGTALKSFNEAVDSVPLLGDVADFLNITTTAVRVNPKDEAEMARLKEIIPDYKRNHKTLDDLLEVGKSTMLRLNPDQLNSFNEGMGMEGMEALTSSLTAQEQEYHDKLDTWAGQVAAGVVEFGAAYGVTPGAGAAQGAGRAASIGWGLLRGAVAEKMILDEGDENLAAMAQDLGIPGDVVWNLISTDPDSPEWQNEMKILGESAVIGGTIEAIAGPLLKSLAKAKAGKATEETLEETANTITKLLREATDEQKLLLETVNAPANNRVEGVVEEVLENTQPLTAADLLTPTKSQVSKVNVKADEVLDNLLNMDIDELADDGLELITGIRNHSQYTGWDSTAEVRAAVDGHHDGIFEAARKGKTIKSLLKKTEEIRRAQFSGPDAPDWAKLVIEDENSARAYLNNMAVEAWGNKMLTQIGNWASDVQAGRSTKLPPALAHLEGVGRVAQEVAAKQLAEQLTETIAKLGVKNVEDISEAARTLASHRWARAGKLKEAEAQLMKFYQQKMDAGDANWRGNTIAELANIVADGPVVHGKIGKALKVAKEAAEEAGEAFSEFVRFTNANLLFNHRTAGINILSEIGAQGERAFLRSVTKSIGEFRKGNVGRGMSRLGQGTTFFARQWRQVGPAWRNATNQYITGIGEITGAAAAFDNNLKAGAGNTYGELFFNGKPKASMLYRPDRLVRGSLRVFQSGINRGLGAVSEFLGTMKIYTQMQDDALMGEFGEKWQKIAKERRLTKEEFTDMFVESDHPILLVERTKSNNLIDAAYADEAAEAGYRDDVRGLGDMAIGQFRRLAYKSGFSAAMFDWIFPFARTIYKVTRKSALTAFPPAQFASLSVWKRLTHPNRAIRNLEYTKAAAGNAIYMTSFFQGFTSTAHDDEARQERIANLAPGETAVMFNPMDNMSRDGELYGYVKVTRMKDGELKENYFLPQELNMLINSHLTGRSAGQFWKLKTEGNPYTEHSPFHFGAMAVFGVHLGPIAQNNLIGNAVDTLKSYGELIPRGEQDPNYTIADKVDTIIAMNAGRVVPGSNLIKHGMSSADNLGGNNEGYMEFNREYDDDRAYKLQQNVAWGLLWRQITRQEDYLNLNQRRGPFGSLLPSRSRGEGLIFKQTDVGEGEYWFSEIMANEFGTDPDKMNAELEEGGVDLKEIRISHDQRSLGDQVIEMLGEVKIGGMTIDERMLYERDNPESAWNREIQPTFSGAVRREIEEHQSPNRPNGERSAGIHNEARYKYLDGIRKEYLAAAQAAIFSTLSDEKVQEIEAAILQTKADYVQQLFITDDYERFTKELEGQ